MSEIEAGELEIKENIGEEEDETEVRKSLGEKKEKLSERAMRPAAFRDVV